jgi:hypothetical protein
MRRSLGSILCLLLVACSSASPRQFLDQYFKVVLGGEDGVSLWCPEKEPATLFAVRSFDTPRSKETGILGSTRLLALTGLLQPR